MEEEKINTKEEKANQASEAVEKEKETVQEENENIEEQTSKDDASENDIKLKEMTDKYLRLSAEFDNYRKRTLKEKIDLTQTAGEDLLKKILPVVDNFERAINSIEKTDDVTALRDGVMLIYNSFLDFLKQNGVKEIECQHSDFNMDEQEAVTKIPAPSEELKGKVVDCIKKGYTLNGKIIRYAQVVVGE